jgi:cytochrome P450
VSEKNGGLPAASLVDSARFVVAGVLPSVVRGLFKPRRQMMKLLTAVDADARAVRVLSDIRRRSGGQGVRLLGGRIVTLWGPEAIGEVLERSADLYASDAGAKGKGMAHFQPDALTVSRGREWRDRRSFNESVLATQDRVHPDAERFLAVIAEEVTGLVRDDELTWKQWEGMFDRITLRVVLGDDAREDQELTGLLESLMGEANRIVGVGEGSDEYYELYGKLEQRLRDPEPGSLIARFASAPQSDVTRVVHQIPHWLFAMRDTLGANAYRALAAIVADPAVLGRVRDELDGADLADPAAVDGLRYLEGCLEEAMRLWPTTPLLARETTREATLAGAKLDKGTQVMIVNTFNHRDAESIPDAHRLKPERWQDGGRDMRFNHLSNGSQDCPGGPLVHLIGKGVLARVLAARELTLEEPDLPGGADLPHMLDFFAIRFASRKRA